LPQYAKGSKNFAFSANFAVKFLSSAYPEDTHNSGKSKATGRVLRQRRYEKKPQVTENHLTGLAAAARFVLVVTHRRRGAAGRSHTHPRL
jgi:hypothetical protein